ncbi:cupin [Chlorella sorokiniana]|uniref:Germin-like protein n=1 Tax=Chlorella sorokiniana TaxID=3076 RepID=A0A2P6TYI4_CHLSO|nr:cupin [Chlorella sorokiniana]|eukprot:PRW59125.1 cupin [Chlorella sorokiniana]
MFKAAALVLLSALLATAPAHGRNLAQAESDSAAASNPFTANLENRTPIVEAQVGIGNASVRVVDSSVMSGLSSTGLSTHLVKLGPCSSLAPHYHPTADEMQLVVQGTLKFVITDLNDNTYTANTTKGDVNVIPKGLVHYIANESCEDAIVDLVFSGNVSRVNLGPSFMLLGQEISKDALGLNSTLDAPMGDIIPITFNGCPDKCKSRR